MHYQLVLVVDDDPAVRESLARVLAGVGYLALTVADGSSALAQVDALAPDAIVSEVGMTGVEIAERLRAQGNETPVVLIGASDTTVDLPGVRFVQWPEEPYVDAAGGHREPDDCASVVNAAG
jgi:CheY-like chemotaxis protein